MGSTEKRILEKRSKAVSYPQATKEVLMQKKKFAELKRIVYSNCREFNPQPSGKTKCSRIARNVARQRTRH